VAGCHKGIVTAAAMRAGSSVRVQWRPLCDEIAPSREKPCVYLTPNGRHAAANYTAFVGNLSRLCDDEVVIRFDGNAF
jgi:hypothetical protein